LKIHDSIALGTASGVVGTFPQLMLHFLAVQLGYNKYFAFQIMGSLYLVKKLTYVPLGYFIGGLLWEAFGAALGILIVYLIRATGREFWWLKGIGVSVGIMFVLIYGFIFDISKPQILPFDIKTNLIMLIGSIIYGVTTSYLVLKWGELPDKTNLR